MEFGSACYRYDIYLLIHTYSSSHTPLFTPLLSPLSHVITHTLTPLYPSYPILSYTLYHIFIHTTEAGTLGRVLGDMAITLCSIYTPKEQLINTMYTPLVIGMIIIIFLCAQYFEYFEV